jgi:Flp pilus assembly pilin Flp
MQTIRRLIPNTHAEAGQTIAEYSILLAAVALVVFLVVSYLGSAVAGLFSGAIAAL